MAFPQVAATSSEGTLSSSSGGALTLPSGVSTGDRLIAIVAFDNDGDDLVISGSGTGWTKLGQEDGQKIAVTSALFEKLAADGDDTITISVTGNTGAGELGTYIVRRYTGHDAAVAAEVASAHGSSTSPDAPSLTPSWGAADTLWEFVLAVDNASRTVTAYPANYTANQAANNHGGTSNTSSVLTAVASRELNATSEDPGAATISSLDNWNAWIVAIKPAGGGGGGATAVTLTGPSSGTVGVASSNFTVGADGTITGTVTVTPSDGGDGGTFSPTSVAISSGTPTATFTYTAANAGTPTATITVTNDGGLTNPSGIAFDAAAAPTGPTIDTQPSNQTVTEGAPASFSVSATSSGGGLSYQWMLDGGDITDGGAYSGATTATLTIDPTTLAMSGDALSVDVTDSNGTTTSAAATLTVNAAASNNVRLSIGAFWDRGGEFAAQTLNRWSVFSLDGATQHHTGTGGTSSGTGIFTIDINDAAFNVGDTRRFLLWIEDSATDPEDRTVTVIGGYVTATAQV